MNPYGKTGTKYIHHQIKEYMAFIDTFLRYSRQMMLPEVGAEGQDKLLASRVLVIGAGGLGCPALQYLTAVGIGTVGIIDFDEVELHNLHRQVLYNETHVGQAKVLKAKLVLETLNPKTKFVVYNEKLTRKNCNAIFLGFDVIVDGSDNFATRYMVNDACVAQSKPLVYGSIYKFEGQMAVFNNAGSKNLKDLFPEPPSPEDVPNCSLNGVIGTLPGIIGTMMAQETIKLIIGLTVLHNELLIFNTLNWNFTKLNF